MLIKVVPFSETHLVQMVTPSLTLRTTREDRQFLMSGPAFSGFLDGRLMGCAGIATLWRGSGEAWAVLTRGVPNIVHRTIDVRFRAILRTGLYRRVQANVLANLETTVRWVEHLGFVEESRMPLFGPNGETCLRYVIFPEYNAHV